MRVLSQSEIDAMLASLLADSSILPGSGEPADSAENNKNGGEDSGEN